MHAERRLAGHLAGGAADHVVNPAQRERGLVAFVESAGPEGGPGPPVFGQCAGQHSERAQRTGMVVQVR